MLYSQAVVNVDKPVELVDWLKPSRERVTGSEPLRLWSMSGAVQESENKWSCCSVARRNGPSWGLVACRLVQWRGSVGRCSGPCRGVLHSQEKVSEPEYETRQAANHEPTNGLPPPAAPTAGVLAPL